MLTSVEATAIREFLRAGLDARPRGPLERVPRKRIEYSLDFFDARIIEADEAVKSCPPFLRFPSGVTAPCAAPKYRISQSKTTYDMSYFGASIALWETPLADSANLIAGALCLPCATGSPEREREGGLWRDLRRLLFPVGPDLFGASVACPANVARLGICMAASRVEEVWCPLLDLAALRIWNFTLRRAFDGTTRGCVHGLLGLLAGVADLPPRVAASVAAIRLACKVTRPRSPPPGSGDAAVLVSGVRRARSIVSRRSSSGAAGVVGA
jgi:hypothetical protein